ncbi:MAG: zeta toxin family protein [Verrucomicrobia bacterium]|nr:zeta toxin family protein [Verrucomicrobiota bacterium]
MKVRGAEPAPGALERLGKILDQRPVLVAVAGPNGAGKTTFYHAHLKPAGLRFLNADEVARELNQDVYAAAQVVTQLRLELVRQRESFVFETVFSDPVGDKLQFLREAAKAGYAVVLCFVGIAGPETSEQRVAMRVSQGGHDVPSEKLVLRFPRTLANLKAAIRELPHVLIFDNDDLRVPFRRVAVFERGRPAWLAKRLPRWPASVDSDLWRAADWGGSR